MVLCVGYSEFERKMLLTMKKELSIFKVAIQDCKMRHDVAGKKCLPLNTW